MLSLIQINERIKSFDFGYTQTSTKPPEISTRCITEQMKIRYSASEMLTMAHIFPHLARDKIPESDQHYQCFLILIKILKLCLSRACYNQQLSFIFACAN